MKRLFLISFILIALWSCQCDNSWFSGTNGPKSSVHRGQDSDLSLLKLDSLTSSKIDHYFSEKNRIGRFNGVVLFADSNKVFQKAYGFSNFLTKDTLSVNTSFQLASVSKPITAAAVLVLVERGQIKLTDSLELFIPEIPYKGITIESLLCHQSGLGNYLYWTEEYWVDQSALMSNQKVIDMMVNYQPPMYSTSNRKYFYNNTNYILLATVIERVSGKSFPTFLKENIFDPLDMHDSFVYTSDSDFIGRNIAVGHQNNRNILPMYFLDGSYGDKGIYSSAIDLYKFDRALRNGGLLKKETIENAYINRSSKWAKPYGLGWRIFQNDGYNIIYHHGWWRGFRTYFIRSMDSQKTIVVLTNNLRSSKLNNLLLLELLEE